MTNLLLQNAQQRYQDNFSLIQARYKFGLIECAFCVKILTIASLYLLQQTDYSK